MCQSLVLISLKMTLQFYEVGITACIFQMEKLKPGKVNNLPWATQLALGKIVMRPWSRLSPQLMTFPHGKITSHDYAHKTEFLCGFIHCLFLKYLGLSLKIHVCLFFFKYVYNGIVIWEEKAKKRGINYSDKTLLKTMRVLLVLKKVL